MDYDVNDQRMLSAGAYYQSHAEVNGGWRPMNTAPRDGTYVELKNTYGVAPTYCLARWTDENFAFSNEGKVPFKADEKSWVMPTGGGPFDETHLEWRPYHGSVDGYVDPTGGAQNSPAYWRGAVAAKYGLPLNTFEKDVQKNISKDAPKPKRPFWKLW